MKSITKQKLFFIPVEVQKREFQGKCLLATLAALEGYQVIFGWDLEIFGLLKNARASGKKLPGVLLYNALCDAEYDDLYAYRAGGAVLFSMAEEQLLPPIDSDRSNPHAEISWKISQRTLALANRVLFWGNSMAERHYNFLPLVEKHSEIVGSLMYDLLREPFLNIHKIQAKAITEKHGDFILMAPNSICSLKEDEPFTLFTKLQCEQYGYEKHFFWEDAESCELQKESFVRLVKLIRNSYPEKKILVRPHPGDNTDYWKSLLADVNNLVVNNTGDAIPWILTSDVLIQTGSSIGHHALFLMHPQIYFNPVYKKDSGYRESVLFKEFFCEQEYEALNLLYTYFTEGFTVSNNNLQQLNNIYANISGPPACKRILTLLNELDWDREVLRATLPEYVEGKRLNLSFPPGRLGKKFQGITLENIQSQLRVYAQFVSGAENIFVHAIGENMYVLSNSDEVPKLLPH